MNHSGALDPLPSALAKQNRVAEDESLPVVATSTVVGGARSSGSDAQRRASRCALQASTVWETGTADGLEYLFSYRLGRNHPPDSRTGDPK